MSTRLFLDNELGELRVEQITGDLGIKAGPGAADTSGGSVLIEAGDGSGSGSGGSISLNGGDGGPTGSGGPIYLQPGYGGGATPSIPVGSGVPEPTELWFVDGQGTPQYVGFRAPDDISATATGDGANTVWVLPEGDGTSNQVIVTDGSGVLSWATPTGLVTPGGADTHVQFNDGGTAFGGEAEFTWDKTTHIMTLGSSGTPATITSPVVANLTIATADNTGTTDVGGNLTLQGADALAAATAGSAGKISLLSGGGQNLVSAADIDLTAGDMAGATKGAGGNVNIEAGNGYGGGEGMSGVIGGKVNITGGNILAGSGSGGGSGDVNATGGTGGTFPGGDVRLTSGDGAQAGNIEINGGTGTNGGGGSLIVTATNHTTGAGGDISMDAGDSGGSAKGGDFSFVAGRGNGTGDGGDIWLTPGEAVDGGAVHGRVIIDDLSGAAGTPARLAFKGTTTPEYVQIQAPTTFTSGTFTMTLPPDEGTSGQVLTTDGGDPATLTWASVGSGTLSFPLLANPNGVAGAPAYSFNAKATTGMYSDASDTIGFSTNGNARVEITNAAVTLKRQTTTELELRFEDGTDGTYVGFRAPDDVTTQTIWSLPVDDGNTTGEVMATDSAGQLMFNKMAYVYDSGSSYTGTNEITSITTLGGGSITSGDYFSINSANNVTTYWVWYDVDSGGGAPTPGAGETLVPVIISSGATASQVADATAAAIAAAGGGLDFTAPLPGTPTLVVTNAAVGPSTDAADVNSGATISVTTQGQAHVITHNLNQRWVTYTIYDRATGARINNAAFETAVDANTLDLTFSGLQDVIVSIMAVPGLGVNA